MCRMKKNFDKAVNIGDIEPKAHAMVRDVSAYIGNPPLDQARGRCENEVKTD